MKLYERHSRAYREMYMPYAKKLIPKLLKLSDEAIKGLSSIGFVWNTESDMFGRDGLDCIVAVVDSRASGIEICGNWLSPSKPDTKEYRTYSYHIYDRTNHRISTWDRTIPVGCPERILQFKLGWIKETIHYGGIGY